MIDSKKYELLRLIVENQFDNISNIEQTVASMADSAAIEERDVRDKVSDLVAEEILTQSLSVNESLDQETENILAFILWSRHRRRPWRQLLSYNCAQVYQACLKEGSVSLQKVIDITGFSQPTVSKYLNALIDASLLEKTKGRPLIVKPSIDDVALFYANAFYLQIDHLQDQVPILNASSGVESIEEEIAKIHIFSSTRTEGNTASRDDVERVLRDLKLHDITATETIEIRDLKNAIETLREFKDEKFSVRRIVTLNKEILRGTEKDAGSIVGNNNISGTSYRPPENRETVKLSFEALCNFLNDGIETARPEILAGLAHFLFVSIHPFVDGNGRTGRLLHSWILMRADRPMFIYDPRLHNRYKQLLEDANFDDVTDFLVFFVQEHQSQLDRLEGESRDPIFELEEKTKEEIKDLPENGESTLLDFA